MQTVGQILRTLRESVKLSQMKLSLVGGENEPLSNDIIRELDILL